MDMMMDGHASLGHDPLIGRVVKRKRALLCVLLLVLMFLLLARGESFDGTTEGSSDRVMSYSS